MSYPHRVRLRGGRNTHAAQPDPQRSAHVNGINHYLLTACGGMANTAPAGYFPKPGPDHRMDDDATVSCRSCIRYMGLAPGQARQFTKEGA